jgi:ssDNA-binding Zn-finger/Zn-ribbon topoisomerase 1
MNTINFVSIPVKCPLCGKSLMDMENKVDNQPGIKMLVEARSGKGTLTLSSIYGSYNFISDIKDFEDSEIVRFYCPHCSENLLTHEICNTCDAPMISLVLEMGGKVSFCSRKGCQNHNIGFNDLSVALKTFYEEFGYSSHHKTPEHIHLRKEKEHVKTDEEETKEIIESGSFLMAYCPHCKKSLIENEMLKFSIVRKDEDPGFILLSPYLNVFSSKSTIYLPEDKVVGDVRCFHCDKSLLVENGKCERCGTAVAKILVSARTKMIEFFICSRKGCTWHGLNKKDLDDIRLEDSVEW